MVRDDHVLELWIYRPVEVPQHKHDTPRLDAGDVPLELCGRESAGSVTDGSDVAVVLDLSQAAAYAPRDHAPVALKAKCAVEERVRERAAFRARERRADVEALCLAGRVPRVPDLGPIVIEPADLEARTHGDRALRVVL